MVKEFIWPRDQPHKKRGFGSGLRDILTGKGPDMYVADWRTPKIDWTEWGRWPQYGDFHHPAETTGSPGGFYHYDDDWRTPRWIRSKRGYKSYDPNKREYRTRYPNPNLGVWPPSYGPPLQEHGGGHGGFGQQGVGWGWARRRRQSMPRSREEMINDWRAFYLPAVLAAGGLNPKKWIWGPEIQTPWQPPPSMTTTTTTLSDPFSESDLSED